MLDKVLFKRVLKKVLTMKSCQEPLSDYMQSMYKYCSDNFSEKEYLFISQQIIENENLYFKPPTPEIYKKYSGRYFAMLKGSDIVFKLMNNKILGYEHYMISEKDQELINDVGESKINDLLEKGNFNMLIRFIKKKLEARESNFLTNYCSKLLN